MQVRNPGLRLGYQLTLVDIYTLITNIHFVMVIINVRAAGVCDQPGCGRELQSHRIPILENAAGFATPAGHLTMAGHEGKSYKESQCNC